MCGSLRASEPKATEKNSSWWGRARMLLFALITCASTGTHRLARVEDPARAVFPGRIRQLVSCAVNSFQVPRDGLEDLSDGFGPDERLRFSCHATTEIA